MGDFEHKYRVVEELKAEWNERADQYNQWDELGLDEIVYFAQMRCLSYIQKLETALRLAADEPNIDKARAIADAVLNPKGNQ